MKLSELEGAITEAEGQRLMELAATCKHLIVEIGSYRGKSTCYLAAGAAPGVKVYAIDLWNLRFLPPVMEEKIKEKTGSKHDIDLIAHFTFPRDGSGNIADRVTAETWNTFLRQTAEYKDKIIPVKGASQEIAKVWRKKIGLLFIDGDHRYEACLADYEGFAPYVVSGGYLALHDYADKHKYRVKKIVDEVIKPSGLWEAWHTTAGMITARRK